MLALEIQQSLEEAVSNDEDLLEKAKLAFQSFTRGYASYPSEVKHIFNIRQLHLGHVARSFGLKEPPTKIKQPEKKEVQRKEGGGGGTGQSKQRKKSISRKASAPLSEFA